MAIICSARFILWYAVINENHMIKNVMSRVRNSKIFADERGLYVRELDKSHQANEDL